MNDKLYWLLDDLKDFIHEKIICRLGFHREMYVEYYEKAGHYIVCFYCNKDL